jgi:serine/threonine-protein kinase
MGGRYETLFQLAAGGMATVYIGTVRGALGFRQVVAIKRPHAHLVADPDFKRDLLSEARLASLLHHANVVDVRDVEAEGNEVSLVMDYVEGASLAELLQNALAGGPKVAPAVAVRIALDALAGLHAAHELTDERGRPVQLVHRDVSPQNLLVGSDGVTRVTDFGVAKFESKGASTTDGHLKGKIAYMAPEYLRGQAIDRRFDVFAMGVVLWETICGKRLFRGEHEADTMRRVLDVPAPPLSEVAPHVGKSLDAVLETALVKAREHRFENARAMGAALESSARAAGLLAEHREVAELVRASCGPQIDARRAKIREKLADEPSIASAFADGAPPVTPTLTAPTTQNPPASPTIRDVAPPVPLEATLRAVAMPAPAPPATTLRSAEPANIPAESEAVTPPVVRSRAPAILGIGAGAVIAVAALGLAFARIGASREAPPPSAAAAASSAPVPAEPPPPIVSAPSVAPTPAPVASRAAPPRRAAPAPKPSAHRPAPTASTDPPPNPYAQ